MPHTSPKIDRRITRTRLALRDAMMFLLVEQGWDDMTIQSICDKADVGRSTFYLHYSSKKDLLQVSLGELRDGLIASTVDLSSQPCIGILNGLLEHMVEQLPVFSTVIGRRSAQVVEASFKHMIIDLIELELKRRQHPAAKKPWLIRFLAGGIHEGMTWWVDAAQPFSIKVLEQKLATTITAVLEQSEDLPE